MCSSTDQFCLALFDGPVDLLSSIDIVFVWIIKPVACRSAPTIKPGNQCAYPDEHEYGKSADGELLPPGSPASNVQ